MNSPLARMLLAVLGGYFALTILWIGFDWIKTEYPTPPKEPVKPLPVQYPYDHQDAIKALRRFSQLPQKEKNAIRENLRHNLLSIQQWLSLPGLSNFQIMCIGEFHEESTRKFLAEKLLSQLPIDVLMLEATPQVLNGILRRMDSKRTYYPLLEADILRILRIVKSVNPGVKIVGIEETQEQEKEVKSREQSIVQNFWKNFQPGFRHFIIFGACHCSKESNWMYNTLWRQAPLKIRERMMSVQVLEEHQSGPLEGFFYFLDSIGLHEKVFVIADTKSLHLKVSELFDRFNRKVLNKYDTLVAFRI